MERIQKLPFILGCFAAMVVGFASYLAGSGNQTIFLRMAVLMTVFFIIGVYIRNTILSIREEIEEKEKEKQKEEEMLAMEELERQKAEADAARHQQASKGHTGQKVDLVAEDPDGEFEPMTVSRVISRMGNE